MTESAEQKRTVQTVLELLEIAELTGIRTYEIRGQRLDSEPAQEPSDELKVMGRVEGKVLETRVRMTQVTPAARLFADIGVLYSLDADVEVDSVVLRDFVEKVGVMAVFPFLRESVFTTAVRLGVDAPVIGLLRAGGFKLDPENEEPARND